jgi:acetylornithine/N-succinyldiaminopimelate aminotransferase
LPPSHSLRPLPKPTGLNQRALFLRHIAQTSPAPLAIEIVKAEGSILIDADGKEYIDLIGGISVANTGHRHPAVLNAIRGQLDAYLHVMVYGEFIQGPQVEYARLLTSHLPASLDSVYFTNSGAEAVEGVMKLSKRVTNRAQIIAFKNSYHGSTQGALSIIGDEHWRNAYRPLLPGIFHADYNTNEAIEAIDEQTACVILEPVQAEAGVRPPSIDWLKKLRERCSAKGAMLVFDEIQAGFGRTGKLWAFEHFGIVPDMLLLGKALGGGMPLGAFITAKKNMDAFTYAPVLGHITTFGGHPVSCAAGLAGMKVLLEQKLADGVRGKEKLFRELLSEVATDCSAIRSYGLWMAIEFDSFDVNKKVIDYCIANGVLTDWFLFAPNCLRICPPLTISEDEIRTSVAVIIDAIRNVKQGK